MEKEIIKTTTFASYFKDFDGSTRDWQEAYFRLLAYKNTFNKFIELDIKSRGDHQAYLYLIVNYEDSTNIKELLKDMGYRNILEYDSKTLELTLDDMDLDIDNVKVYMW